jgi:hypothetical protein
MLLELLKFDIYGEVNLNYLQVEHSTTWDEHSQDIILTINCHFIFQFENPWLTIHIISPLSQVNKIPNLLQSHAKVQLFGSLCIIFFNQHCQNT